VISLDQNDQWIIAGIGAVSEDALHRELIARRDRAQEHFGVALWVRVRIGAKKPATHIVRFFQIANACELGGVQVAVWEPKNKSDG
jgi:hypothetical protein